MLIEIFFIWMEYKGNCLGIIIFLLSSFDCYIVMIVIYGSVVDFD